MSTNFKAEKEINNIFNKSILRLIVLNIKSIYSTLSTRIVVIFSPILVAFALAVLFPIGLAVPAGQVFVVPLSSGVVYAMAYYPIKNSTMNENIKITKANSFHVYVSILLSMFIVTFFSEVSYGITVISFNLMHQNNWISFGGTDGILTDKLPGKSKYKVHGAKVEGGSIIYFGVLSTVLMFVGSFSFRNMCKTQKSYYLILLVYMLFLVGFGGLIPTPYKAIDGNIIDQDKRITFTYVVSMVVPQYHLNTFLMVSMNSGIIKNSGESLNNLGSISSFSWSTDGRGDLTILYPGFTFIGLSMVSYFTIDIG